LQVADEVPLQALEIGEGLGLLAQLLGVVLAEDSLAGAVGLTDLVGRLGLRHRDQANRLGIPVCPQRGSLNPLAHLHQPCRNLAHPRTTPAPWSNSRATLIGSPMTVESSPRSSVTKAEARPWMA